MTVRSRWVFVLVYGGVLFLPLVWMIAKALSVITPELLDGLFKAGVDDLLANSLFLAMLTTLFALALGVPVAFVLTTRTFPGRSLVKSLYFLPLLIPPHIHAIAWNRVVGDQGWLTNILKDPGAVEIDLPGILAPLSKGLEFLVHRLPQTEVNVRGALADPATHAILGHIYVGPAWITACALFPLVTLSVMAGLEAIDPDGVDAARVHSGRALVRRIILPQVMPRILSGAFFVFVLALSSYPVVSLLNTPTLIQRVFFTFSQVDQGAGLVLSLPLVLVAAGVVLSLGFAEARLVVRQTGQRSFVPGRRGLKSLLLSLLPLLLCAGVPLASLVAEAGPLSLGAEGPPDNYVSVFGRVKDAILHSLFFTCLGVVALVLVSYPLGRALARRKSVAAEVLGLASLAFPPVVIGAALAVFWSGLVGGVIPIWFFLLAAVIATLLITKPRDWRQAALLFACLCLGGSVVNLTGGFAWFYQNGVGLVLCALVARFLPFTVRLYRNGFLALDPDEVRAAQLLGHGVLSRSLRVELPRLRGVVLSVAVMAYVLCFTELAATLMVLPAGFESVQVRIFSMVHYQSIGEVSALCVLVTLMAALPVVVLGVLLQRKWELT